MIQIFDKFGRLKSAGIPGLGTVTSISSGNFSPLFTVSISSPTTTPTLSFSPMRYEISAKMKTLRDFFLVIFFIVL